MKKIIIALGTVLAIMTTITTADAQCLRNADGEYVLPDGTPCPNTVITAVPFLRIVADARSGALGDAGIATSPDANAMQFNDSKLVFAEKNLGISATYTPWLRALGLNDVYLAYLSGYYQLDEMQTVGLGLRYFSLGDIAFTSENGEPLGNGRPNEFEIKGSYARKLSEKFSAGLGAKFIYSNLASGQSVNGVNIEAGTAFAADLSFTYRTPIKMEKTSNLMIGLALTNLGSKITYTNAPDDEKDFIPANIGLGLGWSMELDDFNSIAFVTDINKLLAPTPCLGLDEDCDTDGDNIADWRQQSAFEGAIGSFSDAPGGGSEELRELTYSFGLEYWYNKQFAVRAGYYTEHQTKGARSFLTLGLGLKYNVFGLNFSYLVPTTNQQNPLDNTLRFSLLFDFGAFNPEGVDN